MVVKYLAIGVDHEGDVVANSLATDTREDAITDVHANWKQVTLKYVLEITLPARPVASTVPVLKIKLT